VKLKQPRVGSYASPDGGDSITPTGQDTSHDMSGFGYRFLYMGGGHEVAISARVASIASANRAAEDRGIDLWSMTFEESEFQARIL
jgi:hypothetical protein